jgi:hypothetical protein
MLKQMGGIDMYGKHWTAVLITLLALSVTGLAIVTMAGPSAHADVQAASAFAIIAHQPVTHEVGVSLTAPIRATFDEDVNASTVTNDTFVVHGHLGGLAGGTFSYAGATHTVTLDPDRAFHAGEVLRVHATSAISSSGGDPLTPYGWQFTAGEVYSRCVAGFTDIGAGLTGVWSSSVAWGDHDNDGDLDILLTGRLVSKVYRNDGGGAFDDIDAGLTGVTCGSVAWGDYDNDGDLDILLTGWHGGGPVSKVYRNDGTSGFTYVEAGLTGVHHSSVAWGDYDNDGDLDILLTGWDGTGPVSKVYRNDGTSGFTYIDAGLTGVYVSSVAWPDYDNDGDLDILLTGCDGSDAVSKVYRNDGGGAFTDIEAGLTGVHSSSVAWGDYDNDGDLDILLTGWDGSGPASKVYCNDGGGAFTDIAAGLTGVRNSSVGWGDYDTDGDLDILLTGWELDDITPVSTVYRNDGGGAFTDIDAGLTGVAASSVAWGDYDNDGDLDILLTGASGDYPNYDPVSKVYRNNSRPELGRVKPSSGSGLVDATTYFTTTWMDPDGWDDLKQCYFHIGDGPTAAGNVTLMYNAAKDKLWLRSDDGTAWTGGYEPGSDNLLENGQAKVFCKQTRARGVGDTLGVAWAIEFKPAYTGTKKLGLKCKDSLKAKATAEWKGTWTIAP